MNSKTMENSGDTVRILRPPPKVYTDELGHSVWMSGIEPFEFHVAAEPMYSTDPYNYGLTFTPRA